MTDMRFEWDPAKAASNLRKHDIAFEDAVQVFRDPLRLTVQDRIDDGELRWQTTGAMNSVTIVLVAHVDREDDRDGITHVRIISARKATRPERKRYEDETGQLHP